MDWLIDLLRDNVWNGIGGLIVLLGALYGIGRYVATRKPRWRYIVRGQNWIVGHIRNILGFVVFLITILVANLMFKDGWFAILIIVYTLALVVIFRVNAPPLRRSKTKFTKIPLLEIVNTTLDEIYDGPPSGEQIYHGVPFYINGNRYDTSKDDLMERELGLGKTIKNAKSVHLLINAGGARSKYLGYSLGRIKLIFNEGPPQFEELSLGTNIREWAIGNATPDVLVTEVHDKNKCRRVWYGNNVNGNAAIIDMLNISVEQTRENKDLDHIIIVRYVGPGTEEPPLGFFISAITIES